MPKLPSIDAPLPVAQPRQAIVTYDGTQVARANAQLGQTIGGAIERVAGGMLEKQDRYNFAQAKSAFLKAQVELENELADDQDYTTYAERYNKRMNEAKEASLKMIRNPSDRALFQQDLELDIQRGLGSVQRKAKSKEIDVGRGTLMETINMNREMALQAGDEATRVSIIKATQDAIEGAKDRGYLSDQESVQWRQRATEDYALASVEMLDPAGQLEALSKGGFTNLIPADKRAQLKMRAEKQIEAERKQREIEARQLQAIARAELSSQVQDATAAYLSGVEYATPPSEEQFRAAYGKDADKMYSQFQKTQEIGLAIRDLATATPEERAEMIANFNPTKAGIVGEGFAYDAKLYGTLVNAAVRLEKELEADPATYAAKYSPALQQAWQAASQGDPAAAEAYAAATIAEQQRLGVQQPNILPQKQADAIANQFANTSDGGANSAQLIQELQQQWGKHWPLVYKQLQNKLPGAAMVIGTGIDEQTAATLARISDLKPSELKKGLDSTDTKAANDSLNEAMAPFRATLASLAGGDRTYTTMRNEAEKLVYAYMGSGISYKDAVDRAVQALIEQKYTIKGTWRAPKQYDADLIEDGAAMAKQALDASELLFRAQPGVSEDFAKERVKAAINKDGYWVTLPDESGLALYYGGEAVLSKDGEPIIRSWDELTGKAAENPSAYRRFIEGNRKMREALQKTQPNMGVQ